jgi:uncharacterized membrane protein
MSRIAGRALRLMFCPPRKVPRLRGVGVDLPAFNIAVLGYGGGTCVECWDTMGYLCGVLG